MTIEAGFAHQCGGLRARATHQHGAAAGLEFIGEFFERGDTGGVDSSHVAEAKDNDGRKGIECVGNLGELVSDAEEKWTVDAEYGGVVWDVFVLQAVNAAVFD